MNAAALALRNLSRNRRRSLTTVSAIVVGLVAILLFGGYVRSIKYGLQTDYVQRTGHLQIHHKGYFLYGSGNPAAYGIAGYARVIDAVKADPVLAPMLKAVTPTLLVGGIAGNFAAGTSRPVFVNGIVVDDVNRMHQWNDYQLKFTPGQSALTGSASDAAIIGAGVARSLQLCRELNVPDCAAAPVTQAGTGPQLPADIAALPEEARARTQSEASPAPDVAGSAAGPVRIELLAASAHGVPNVASLAVVKAEYQGIKELDDVFVALNLPLAQRLVYGADSPQVTAIVVQLAHTAQIGAARARLASRLAERFPGEAFEVHDFTELNAFYGQVLAMFDAIFGFISVLIGAIVLFTVGNTMSMAVVERTTEIGTLRAIGLRRAGLRRMFLIEGLALGAAGAVLGAIAAVLLATAVNRMGLTWMPPGRIDRTPLTVHVLGEPLLVAGSALWLVAVTAVSAILPAARAARMNIVDALRHV